MSGSAEFFVDGNINGEKIEIFNESEGQLVVEFSVRIPKDPRGWKRVVSKRGTWTSSKSEQSGATYESLTTINFEGQGATAISFSEDKKKFTFDGKTFELV